MREYVQDYALIAKPLSDLLRKMIPFRFNGEQKLAFQMLKSKLTERSVSTIFRNDAETEVHTDAANMAWQQYCYKEVIRTTSYIRCFTI